MAGIGSEPFIPDNPVPERPTWLGAKRAWPPALVEHYLDAFTQPGDLVLDPFAQQPALAAAAASSGRRVLLTHFSPLNILKLSLSLTPPDSSLLDSVFSRLADAPRRGRTLAVYLQSLYETVCPDCAQNCPATYFVWDRAVGEPAAKGYACPHCDSRGEVPADLADVELAAGLEVRGAAYWGLLSRLVPPGDPLLPRFQALLELYTSRALLAIHELLLAMEQRLTELPQRQVGRTLLLHMLEQCVALWEPAEKAGLPPTRPAAGQRRRLQLPPRFVEHNVWLALEEAYRELHAGQPGQLSLAPNLASLLGDEGAGKALLLASSLPDLAQRLEPASVALVLSTSPVFDPLAYVLTVLWTGWLYGRQAIRPLRTFVQIERLNWDWYGRAMTSALRTLRTLLKPEGRLVFVFGDSSTRRVLALLAAASRAGLRLVGQATRVPLVTGDEGPDWRLIFAPEPGVLSQPVPEIGQEALEQAARHMVQHVVSLRGEPTPEALLQTACAAKWQVSSLLAQTLQAPQAVRRPVTTLWQQMRVSLSPEMLLPGVLYCEPGAAGCPPCWAPERPGAVTPLADRVEVLVARLLAERALPTAEIEARLYHAFPGWETPDAALIAACLRSYGRHKDGVWCLRPEDEPGQRARERGEILLQLRELGRRLGFAVWVAPWEQEAALGLVSVGQGGPERVEDWAPLGLVWHEEGKPVQAFAISLRAVLQPWLEEPPRALSDCPRYVVVPGGRAELLAFKLQRCPWWQAWLVTRGWEFIKFRHVRRLAALSSLTLAGFRARIGLDPIVARPEEQLSLFDAQNSSEHLDQTVERRPLRREMKEMHDEV